MELLAVVGCAAIIAMAVLVIVQIARFVCKTEADIDDVREDIRMIRRDLNELYGWKIASRLKVLEDTVVNRGEAK